MRAFELSTDIQAPPTRVWETLEHLEGYDNWSSFLPYAAGSLRRGGTVYLRAKYSQAPVSIEVDEIVPGRRFVLSRDLFHRKLVHLTHSFAIHELEPRATRFTQRWEATGLLVPLMWNKLASVMAKFEAFGADLKVHVEGRAHRGPES